MSDTPRTDAEAREGWSGDAAACSVEFTQGLEREIATLKAENERLLMANRDNNDWFNSLKADYETLKSWQVVAADALNYAHRLLWTLIDRGEAPRELLVVNGGRGMEPINVALAQCPVRQPIDNSGRPLPLEGDECQHDMQKPKATICVDTANEAHCTVCRRTFSLPVKLTGEQEWNDAVGDFSPTPR